MVVHERHAGIDQRQSGQAHDSEHRSEEHTSELQSRFDLVCRLLLEKKKKTALVIMKDFKVVPYIVLVGTMREAVRDLGSDPHKVTAPSQSDECFYTSRIVYLFRTL